MLGNVAERLLQDAEQGRRALVAEANVVMAFAHFASDARALAKLRHLPFDGRIHAQVQHGRAQVVDDLPHALDGGVDLLQGRAGAGIQARVAAMRARGQHVGVDAQDQQILPQVVVDFARDALALFFLDLVGVGRQAAQFLVRQLQTDLAGAQFFRHAVRHLDGAPARRCQSVEQHV
ncbi:hypothetical protein D3C72_1274300 [compost metagenome]